MFDYYGETAIESKVLCLDRSDDIPKDAGYRYTCERMSDGDFGPHDPFPSGRVIETCCLSDSPTSAIRSYCEIDFAEEVCLGGAILLNELRHKIPEVLSQLHEQLLALNQHVARPEVQSDCAIALAKALREPGPSSWLLDDSENWSWFREFRLTVKSVQFREFVNTGEVCTKPLYSGPLCVFGAYQLSVAGQPRLQGRFDRSQPAGVVILPMPAVASGVVLVGAPLDADLWPFQVRLSVVGEPCGPP